MRLTFALSAILATVLAWPGPAVAGMSAAEFDAYTRGQTFHYGTAGAEPYGAEEYLPGRRVRWSFLDGECQDGYWYADGPRICFVYDTEPEPQCWQFERGSEGLEARFDGDDGVTELYEMEKSRAPLTCPGPKIGV